MTHDLNERSNAIKAIRANQVIRNRLIVLINAQANAIRSLARRLLGFRIDLPEKDRRAINKRAAQVVDRLNSGEPLDSGDELIGVAMGRIACVVQESSKPLVDYRKQIEAHMATAAKTLPVYPWVESVKGLGALGLAIIVGECGDLGGYDGPAKLWKRLGLAPKSCYSMVTKDGSAAAAVPRRRRSASWTIADSLLRNTGNPYYAIYQERRKYECQQHPEFDKGVDPKTGKHKVTKHCDVRARRYAEKRMLRDLWRAWRDSESTSRASPRESAAVLV